MKSLDFIHENNNEKTVHEYFGFVDLYSCAQHQEIKILVNKYYRQYIATLDKYCEMVLEKNLNWEDNQVLRKFQGLEEKMEKFKIQFNNSLRGLKKCCISKDFCEIL